jgi:tRNA/rRNA methyltransferase
MVRISFILMEPSVPGNIGAAARAMKTMGFSDLRLINPCDYRQSDETWKLAHGSHDVIEHATLYNGFHEAAADLDLLVGTTAKRRSAVHDYYSCREVPGLLSQKGSVLGSAGIVFGAEESGLPNEILRKCDIVSYIPMTRAYPSLNLSQAVMIYAYTFFMSGVQAGSVVSRNQDQQSMKMLKQKVTKILKLVLDNNQTLEGRIMERLMVMGEDDVHLAHSLCNRLLEVLAG